MNTAVRPYEVLAHSHLSTIVEGNEFTHGRPVREKERLPAELLFGKRRNSLHNKRRSGGGPIKVTTPTTTQPHTHPIKVPTLATTHSSTGARGTNTPSRLPRLQPHTHPQGAEKRESANLRTCSGKSGSVRFGVGPVLYE